MSEEPFQPTQAHFDRLQREWTEQRSIQVRSQEALDRSLLTLSSAALGLSLAFASQLAGTDAPSHQWAIISSWSCFLACILSTLVSFVTSQMSIDEHLERAEAYYLRNEGGAFDTVGAVTRATTVLNCVSLATFGSGAVLTFVFVASNL